MSKATACRVAITQGVWFTLNLYRKSGEISDAFNGKLVAIAKAAADRL